MQRAEFELGISCLPDWGPGRHGHRGFTFCNAIFDKVIQLLLHSKVTKAESYLIGGYHNKWLELTYYIETLSDSNPKMTQPWILNLLKRIQMQHYQNTWASTQLKRNEWCHTWSIFRIPTSKDLVTIWVARLLRWAQLGTRWCYWAEHWVNRLL